MNHKYIAVLSIGLFILLRLGSPISPVTAQTYSASQVFQLVNQVRAEHGLTPFQLNQALTTAAQNQANFNANNSYYGHTGQGGSSPQDRANAAGYVGYVVENVVGGTSLTPQQGVTWWINSPIHYNTLITTRYTEAGTGYATDGSQNHYTLVVGRRSDQPINSTGSNQPSGPPALVVPITLSPPGEDGSIVHKVRSGQTLWAIAARYNVRLDTLLLYNNLNETSFIRPGDELLIQLAEGQSPPPTPTPPLTHIVREGETLWTVAARYNLKLSDLLWYNRLNEESIIQPGDELTIRLAEGQPPPPTPTPQLTHIVQSGESIWGIAAFYGLTIERLIELNNLVAGTIIQPGDQLFIRAPDQPTPTITPITSPQPTAVSTTDTLQPSVPPPTSAPQPSPNPPQIPTPTPAPVISRRQTEQNIITGTIVTGIGLTILALIVAITIRRQE